MIIFSSEKLQIKVSVVVSDIFGASGRDMLAALVAEERNPKVLAQLARRTMCKKITVLEEAFTGRAHSITGDQGPCTCHTEPRLHRRRPRRTGEGCPSPRLPAC